jgi:hypothetical protein
MADPWKGNFDEAVEFAAKHGKESLAEMFPKVERTTPPPDPNCLHEWDFITVDVDLAHNRRIMDVTCTLCGLTLKSGEDVSFPETRQRMELQEAMQKRGGHSSHLYPDYAEAVANHAIVGQMHKANIPLPVMVGFLSKALRDAAKRLIDAQMMVPFKFTTQDGRTLIWMPPEDSLEDRGEQGP